MNEVIIESIMEGISKFNLGINFFAFMASLITIIAFCYAVKDYKDGRKFEYKIQREETERIYFEKRQDIYKRIIELINKYEVFLYSRNNNEETKENEQKKTFSKVKEELDNDYHAVRLDLGFFFPKRYVDEFDNLFNKAINNLRNEDMNNDNKERNRKNYDESYKKALRTGKDQELRYVELEKIEKIRADVESFEEKLFEYITSHSNSNID